MLVLSNLKPHFKEFLTSNNVSVVFPVNTLSVHKFPCLVVLENGPVINLYVNITMFAQNNLQ